MSLWKKLFRTKEATRVYRAAGWNIEFDIPVDWEVFFENRPEPPGYGVFGIVGKRATGPRPSLLLMTQVVEDTGEGLDAYMNGAERQLRKEFANFSMIKKRQDQYQGAPSAVMEYSYQGNRGPIQELNMTTFFGERMKLAFQFICEATKAEIAQDRALQRRIIDSIRIGSRGIRVPYLRPYGRAASTCAACRVFISEPNALFSGRKTAAFYCDKCWQTA